MMSSWDYNKWANGNQNIYIPVADKEWQFFFRVWGMKTTDDIKIYDYAYFFNLQGKPRNLDYLERPINIGHSGNVYTELPEHEVLELDTMKMKRSTYDSGHKADEWKYSWWSNKRTDKGMMATVAWNSNYCVGLTEQILPSATRDAYEPLIEGTVALPTGFGRSLELGEWGFLIETRYSMGTGQWYNYNTTTNNQQDNLDIIGRISIFHREKYNTDELVAKLLI